jgi:hypothetical protein
MSFKLTLHSEHLADLRESGLSDETITKGGLESIPPDLIVKEIGNYPNIKSAYRIPYLGTDGFCRCKAFYHEGKTGPKYLQRKNSGNRLFIPEKARYALGDASVPLYITEGEKKGLKACQESLSCIGLSGLWNWSNGNKELIPDFDLIAFGGRTVFIVPDNDWRKPSKHGYRKNLDQAVYGLGQRLIEREACVSILLLPDSPDKIGLDDYLVNHTIEEFFGLPTEPILTLEQRIENAVPTDLKNLLKEIAQEPGESRKALLLGRVSDRYNIPKRALNKDIQNYSAKGKNPNQKPIACASFPGLVDIVENEKFQTLFLVKGLELTLATEVEREGEVIVPPEKKDCPFALGNFKDIKKHYLSDADTQLYREVYERLKIVSILSNDHFYHLATAYIFFTYLLERVLYYPYLWFFGQPERGKSRIAKAVINLSYRGFYTETLNEAYLFRFADRFKGTIGLDVYEISEKAQKKGSYDFLLGRFERGGRVARVTNPDKPGFGDTKYFDCWGPTVLATNVEIPAHDPLRSRCLKITMPEARGNYPNNNSIAQLTDLKNRLLAFRARNLDKELREVEKPVAGRLGDIMQPLFYVAQLLPPEAKENLISLIAEFDGERKQSESETLAGKIVQALFDLQSEVTKGRLPFELVEKKVNERIDPRYCFSPQTIGRELSSLGINRIKSHGVKVLVWEPLRLNEIFKRYLAENFIPNIPNVPNAELTRAFGGEELLQSSPMSPTREKMGEPGEKIKIMSPSVNTELKQVGDNGEDGDEFLNPKKIKFSTPIEIDEAF